MPMSPPKSGIQNRFYHTLIEQKKLYNLFSATHPNLTNNAHDWRMWTFFARWTVSKSGIRTQVLWTALRDFLASQPWGWFSKRETFLPRPSSDLPTTFRRFLRARRRSASTRTSRNIESRIWTQGSTARRRTGRTARWRRAGRWGRLNEEKSSQWWWRISWQSGGFPNLSVCCC